jgi:hypothetical protein
VSLIGPYQLQEFRDLASDAMTDRCTISRSAGRGVYNPETNTHDPAGTAPVWSGRCRVASSVAGQDVTVGALHEVLGRYIVHIPYDTPTVQPGDVVTVTESADPQLLGQRLTVESVPMSTVHARRRLVVQDPQYRDRP